MDNGAVGAFVEELCELAAQRKASDPSAAALFVSKVPRRLSIAGSHDSIIQHCNQSKCTSSVPALTAGGESR